MPERRARALLLALILASGCAIVPITGRKQLSLLPAFVVLALGEENYHQVLDEAKLSEDEKQVQMVKDVGIRIATSTEDFMRENRIPGREDYQWEFALIEDEKQANAWCMPGGKIGVYTGILPITQDKNGLAAVLAHEIAHAMANHGGERLSQALAVELGGATLARALREKPERTQELFLLAYGVGANVGVLLPYSRLHEREADRIGLILMARAGYNPRTAIGLWERMNKHAGQGPPEFLSTHPAPERRIQYIRERLPEAMYYYKKNEAGGS